MKCIQPTIAILVLILSPAVAWTEEVESIRVGKNIAQSNCNWCHGSMAHGFSTAPQLATQNSSYLENQLLSLKAHLQDSPSSRQYMWGAAAKLDSQTAHAVAVYFSTLNAEAASDGVKALIATGQIIYREGIPASNISSCVPCHGLDAAGVGDIPRLGGQSYGYLRRKLLRWGEGYDAATEPPMPAIARKLSAREIQALASYLSFVK